MTILFIRPRLQEEKEAREIKIQFLDLHFVLFSFFLLPKHTGRFHGQDFIK